MEPQHIFLIVWFFITIPMILLFYSRGKKALSIFPKLERVNVLFRENGLQDIPINHGRQKLEELKMY